MWETIVQIAIFILSASAILLVAKKNKWGFVIGLTSQPFLLYTSYIHEQWGIFIVSIVYVFSWILGIYEWFFKDEKTINKKQ